MNKPLPFILAAVALLTVVVQGPLPTAEAAQRPLCFGEPATIFVPGTESSASTVQGTDGDDVIVTGPGDDRVRGLRGRDLICTRGGRDVIRGGRGDDAMRGGAGADRVAGRHGLDRANGGRGANDACGAEREHACEKDL